ncbi:uncharacterized protein LOC133799612 [Humulus lupulus]|uniref:uncharacterized protein LOC133799612 n=1 Tax=Humulus lupulus TaxID=3486 RepID=UPI002B4165EE|nr:uncharacterized protein LOC133799612 [Humulus lupulus]
MDKSWTSNKNRLSTKFINGLKNFITLSRDHLNDENKIRCPCVMCMNLYFHDLETIERHIFVKGFYTHYVKWVHHGENIVDESDGEDDANDFDDLEDVDDLDDVDDAEESDNNYTSDDDMIPAIEDLTQQDPTKSNFANFGDSTHRKEKGQKFHNLFAEVEKELYPGCKKFTSLTFIVKLMRIKVLTSTSIKAFDMLLKLLKEAFPDDNKIPNTYYDVKKILHDLGLGYETIHVCEHDCSLYWKDNKDAENCHICGHERYKFKGTKDKKIPHKKMHYFPITPRLQRLFMSRHTSSDMRWHKEERVDTEGVLRHPADAAVWKDFDKQYPDFAKEPRNIRFGFATDGFNPFGDLSNSYSMWPVILMPYNMPPWICMKREFLMMSLLIPRRRAPDKDIDVYLQPLIEELKELWEKGVQTFDVVDKTYFIMRAAILWTINDFPAYGTVSGYSTQGYKACPICEDDTSSFRIRGKICYMGHRRYLCAEHEWRTDKEYDGTIERRSPPRKLTGDEIVDKLDHLWTCRPGKYVDIMNDDKNQMKKAGYENKTNWRRKSIFWELEYWPKLKLRHNLDVMHIEKNICDSVVGTIFSIDGKSKDTENARLDLQDLKIRKQLQMKRQGNKWVKPAACYTLSKKERKQICEFLQSIKFPNGYAANLSHNVNMKDGKITGLKSHDCHILLQMLLPISVRPYLKKKMMSVIAELSLFFQNLCARTLYVKDLDALEEGIVFTLCKMEIIFPPAFFDVMIHLAVHLPMEAKLRGPVQMRWMYSIEREIGHLKKYVKNKARPEGSIAEGYIINEALNFCSMYLHGIETRFNRPDRNPDEVGVRRQSTLSIFNMPTRPFGKQSSISITEEQRNMVHWYIVNNCPELEPYLKEHRLFLQSKGVSDIDQAQKQEFPSWFEDKVKRMNEISYSKAQDDLYAIAIQPNFSICTYAGCMVNGVRYHTKTRDERRITQNCGIRVEAEYDGNLCDFYGVINEIWEVHYIYFNRVILFKCSWYNTNESDHRIYTEYNITSINVASQWFENEPFVLANQVNSVFYLDDIKRGENWKVVQKVNHRHIWEIPSKPQDSNSDDVGPVTTNREAYQEEFSSDIDITFDSTNVDDILIRQDIDEIEIDDIDYNECQNELDNEDIDEEALLSDSEDVTDSDESD